MDALRPRGLTSGTIRVYPRDIHPEVKRPAPGVRVSPKPYPELDRTDRAIVDALRDDGRRAYRDIARDLGVSESMVRKRAKRLPRVQPGAEGVMDHQPAGAVRHQPADVGGRTNGPACLPLPQRLRRCRPRARQIRALGGKRLQPAKPRIARILPRGRRHLGPEPFGHDQRIELERLLRVPVLGHMGGQRAHQPAAGPGADVAAFDHLHPRPALRADPGQRQAEDPAAHDCDCGHCHSPCCPPWCPRRLLRA